MDNGLSLSMTQPLLVDLLSGIGERSGDKTVGRPSGVVSASYLTTVLTVASDPQT